VVLQPARSTPRQRKRSGAHTIEKDDGTTYRRNAKRLTDGRGSIFFDKRRKRSPWVAQLPPVDGRIENRTFGTKDEADAWRQQQMALRDKGIRPLRDETLGWWLDHWYRTRVVGHKKAKTVDLYAYLIRLHIMGTPLAEQPLAKVKPQHLREFYATVGAKRRQSRRKDGPSPDDDERPTLARSTVLNLHAVLSGAFAQAVADRKIEHNPASSARPPRPERKRIEALSAQEVDEVILALGDHRLVDVLELCLECGLRVGEAIGLTWDRIHLDATAPWATIDRQLQCLKGIWRLEEPKRRSIRVVGLTRRACEVLRRARDRQTFEKRAVEQAASEAEQQGETTAARWGWSWNQARRRAEPIVWHGREPMGDEGLVFTSQTGGPIHRSTVTHTLQREVERAGLSEALAEKLGRALTTHHMRHQHASELLASGAPISDVRDQLGHRETATTLDMYGHSIPGAPSRLAALRDAHRDARRRATATE
jgi:integrase